MVQPCKQQLWLYTEAEWSKTTHPAAGGLCCTVLIALSTSTAQERSWHPPLSLILPLRKVLLQSLPEVQLSNTELAVREDCTHQVPRCRQDAGSSRCVHADTPVCNTAVKAGRRDWEPLSRLSHGRGIMTHWAEWHLGKTKERKGFLHCLWLRGSSSSRWSHREPECWAVQDGLVGNAGGTQQWEQPWAAVPCRALLRDVHRTAFYASCTARAGQDSWTQQHFSRTCMFLQLKQTKSQFQNSSIYSLCIFACIYVKLFIPYVWNDPAKILLFSVAAHSTPKQPCTTSSSRTGWPEGKGKGSSTLQQQQCRDMLDSTHADMNSP